MAVGILVGSARSSANSDRVAKQGDEAVADEAGGRVVSSDDQLKDRREQFLVVEALVSVAGADQTADQVVSRVLLLGLDECSQHAHNGVRRLFGRRVLRRSGGRDKQLGEPLTERGAVGRRHTEQLADDRERQREGEGPNKIDPAVGSLGGDVVEEVVRHRLHVSAQRLDPPRREGSRDEPPKPGVVGWVDGEHVPGERRSGQALGHDTGARRQGGVHVLGEPRVVECGQRLFVAGHQPGAVPVGQCHRMHRAEPADLGEHRERVVEVVGPP